MSGDTLSVILPLVKIAEKEGADEVEFYALSRNTNRVDYENSSLKSASASRAQGVGIRVLANKSLGFASANSFDREKILEALKDAISIAKTTPSMDHYYLSPPRKIKHIKNLYDEGTASLSMSQTIEYGKDLLKQISDADSRVSVESGQLSSNVDEYAIATSTGIESSEMRTALSWYIFGWAVDGSIIGSMDLEFDSVVAANDMDLGSGAKMFVEKVIKNLGAEKSDAFRGEAIFSPEASQDLFDMLMTSTKSTAIQSGSSFLQDKLGEKIAISDLTITDDGTHPGIATNSSFDREGIPRAPLNIIDSGVFKAVLYNTFTANKDELVSTGHASGGFRAAPNIGTTYTEIQQGAKSFDEMVSEIDKGLYIQ
ncbi:MAG: TldD/PmbA family protein, partial [Candidatus Thorarchaeota archaeon]